MSDFVRRDFEASYQGSPPWDIGAPQPEVVHLEGEGGFRGSVLDVGCGTGENALFLAERGHPAVGVDSAPTAVALARGKATARRLEVPFHVVDALDLAALRQRFETALDCGLFHVLGDEQRKLYAQSLAAAVGPGGEVHLLCFSDEEPPGWGPRRIAEWDIREAFRGLFVLSRIRKASFATRDREGGAKAWLATLTRL